MKDDRLPEEDRHLANAFRSVRDAYDGASTESNLTLQRALLRTRRDRRQRLTRWAVLPIAAVLVASTAWAGVTGRLAPVVHSVMDTFRDEPAPPAGATGATGTLASPPPVALPAAPVPTADRAPSEPAASTDEAPAPAPPPPPAPVAGRAASPTPTPSLAAAGPAAVAPSNVVAAPSASAPAEAAPPDPQDALFAEAHRLHFTERDPARALAAWDRYLAAAPHGRLAPEARYNRALTLVRLGRRAEAQQELSAFAGGMYGEYRRPEAKALLDAFARDASP